MEQPARKTVRLHGYDYNMPGYYFITLCTRDKERILCEIVENGIFDTPSVIYSEYGRVAEKHLRSMSDFYEDLKVEKYVIMPNHIHLLIHVMGTLEPVKETGPSNSRIARFIGTFKRFCNKEYGRNIWQGRSFDHIVRGERDYQEIWRYIDENPIKWEDDCFYGE